MTSPPKKTRDTASCALRSPLQDPLQGRKGRPKSLHPVHAARSGSAIRSLDSCQLLQRTAGRPGTTSSCTCNNKLSIYSSPPKYIHEKAFNIPPSRIPWAPLKENNPLPATRALLPGNFSPFFSLS